MSVGEAVKAGRVAVLTAVQRRLAEILDNETTPAGEAASVAGRLVAVTAELDQIAPAEVSAVDELANRRVDRRTRPAKARQASSR
jgi:hypothetical protein